MNILLLNGSPHKGNTWHLTQLVKDTLHSWDKAITFTEIHLTNLDLPFCTGCSSCFRLGHQSCPHHDKVQGILDLIQDHDGIIFSVSCFQGHLTGIMKNLTDHLAFLIHRPRFFHKKALIISTAGGISADSTTKALAATLAGWGFNRSYQVPIIAYSWNAYEPTSQDLEKAEEAAYKFYQDLKLKKVYPPSLESSFPLTSFGP